MPATPLVTENPSLAIPVHSAQLKFLQSDARYRGFVGGRGAGKTFICAYDLIKRAKPKRFYMVVSPTYGDVKDVTFPTFQHVCDRLRLRTKIRKTDFRGTFNLLGGDWARIAFRSADDPETLRGPSVTHLWLDEASMMPVEVFDIGIACLRESWEAGRMTAGFTPKGKTHWTYKVFVEKKLHGEDDEEIDAFLITSPTKSNPFVAEEFVHAVTGAYGRTTLAAQELGGEFVELEGQLLRYEWMLACQADTLWPSGIPPRGFNGSLYLGIDIGRTRDRTVIWTWERLGDVCWCRDIKVLHDMPFAEQMNYMRGKINRWTVKCIVDAGGIGKPLAEDLEREYPGVVEGITLGPDAQKRIAERMRVGFETRAVRIPDDRDLRDDLQLVVVGKNGNIETGRKTTVGHADRFWAGAMGYDVAVVPPAVSRIPPAAYVPNRRRRYY